MNLLKHGNMDLFLILFMMNLRYLGLNLLISWQQSFQMICKFLSLLLIQIIMKQYNYLMKYGIIMENLLRLNYLK